MLPIVRVLATLLACGGGLVGSSSPPVVVTSLEAAAKLDWQNRSREAISAILSEGALPLGSAAHRSLLAYAKLGKVSTLSFVHIAKTGGLSFNKLLVENRGIAGRDGNRIPDCIIPRAAYGNQSLPLSARFDFPRCEILSAIWPLPTVQVGGAG